MARVVLSRETAEQLEQLPVKIHARMLKLLERLAKWPEVSGPKPLRHERAG
jgi:hypothetical protein